MSSRYEEKRDEIESSKMDSDDDQLIVVNSRMTNKTVRQHSLIASELLEVSAEWHSVVQGKRAHRAAEDPIATDDREGESEDIQNDSVEEAADQLLPGLQLSDCQPLEHHQGPAMAIVMILLLFTIITPSFYRESIVSGSTAAGSSGWSSTRKISPLSRCTSGKSFGTVASSSLPDPGFCSSPRRCPRPGSRCWSASGSWTKSVPSKRSPACPERLRPLRTSAESTAPRCHSQPQSTSRTSPTRQPRRETVSSLRSPPTALPYPSD